jgi:hypothetical protein
MNKQQIIRTLNKIEKCKKEGHLLEALINNYHLNISVLRFLLIRLAPNVPIKELKVKGVLLQLIEEVNVTPSSKTIISKKNLKALKPWLIKFDSYLKVLKQKAPTNTKSLLTEGEQVFMLLNISLSKMHIRIPKKK